MTNTNSTKTPTAASIKAAEAAESLETLRELLPAGTDVYSIVRSVSSSGMSRKISFLVVSGGELRDITWHMARALDYKLDSSDRFALKVRGAGMDMCFAVVYEMSRALFAGDQGGYVLTSRAV